MGLEQDLQKSSSRQRLRAVAAAVGVLLLLATSTQAQLRESVEQYPSGDKDIRIECFAPMARGPFPAVFFLYGSGGMAYGSEFVYRDVVRTIASRGYVAMIPHLFGARDHVVGARIKTGEFEAWQAALRDAVEYAAARPDVDPDRIGLFGYSMGAHLAFVQAARDPRIKAIVSLSGNAFMSRRSTPPILILHGAKDPGSPVKRIKEWDQVLTENEVPHEVHVYRGVGHNFDSFQFVDVSRRAGMFFDKYLKKSRRPAKASKQPSPRATDGEADAGTNPGDSPAEKSKLKPAPKKRGRPAS